MLTYDDGSGLSELTPEEIAAIAKREHLPEIVALGTGWRGCGTPEGERPIRRVILDDTGRADERDDTQAAARLGLVPRHLVETRPDRHGSTEPRRQAGGARDVPAAPHDDGDRLARPLGPDAAAAPWVRERVDAYLTAMLGHFGLDRASVQEHALSEMRMAETLCGTCTETGRCRRFLAGAEDGGAPSAFRTNAELFAGLRGRGPRSCPTPGAEWQGS